MTSERKIEANRANALRSTGARTRRGKARVRRNALRHGLAASVLKNAAIPAEVERLAKIIAGNNAKPAAVEQAIVIAETELTLLKIRAMCAALIDGNAFDLSAEPQPGAVPEGAQQEAALLAAMPVVLKLDRYERRALSRGERAMRDFARP